MGRGACVSERARSATQSATALQYCADQNHRRDPPQSGRQARAHVDALGPHSRLVEEIAKGDAGDVHARAESVASKPMFRNAFKGRRCIIPASGFYEWTGEKGDKQPHLFTAADGSPILAFAGLWDRWHDSESGEEVLSCTIIVCGASEWMKAYHDRMPMILEPKDFDAG